MAYVEHEAVVYIRLGNVCVEVLTFDEAEEELVNDLDVGPRYFQDRLVFFGIKGLALGVHRRRDGTEQVLGKHFDYTRVHLLGDDLAVVGDIVEQLVQGQALDLLGLHVTASIIEIEDDVALVNLLHEELLALVGGHFVKPGQLLQLTLALI